MHIVVELTPGPASGAVPTNVAVNWPGTVEFRSRGEDNDRRGATPSCWYRGRGSGDDAECTSGSAIRTLRVHGGAGHRRPRSLHGTMRGVSSARPSGEQRGRAARGRELHDDLAHPHGRRPREVHAEHDAAGRRRLAQPRRLYQRHRVHPGGQRRSARSNFAEALSTAAPIGSVATGTSATAVIGGGAGGGGADPAAAGQQAGRRSREAGRRGVTVVGEVEELRAGDRRDAEEPAARRLADGAPQLPGVELQPARRDQRAATSRS